MFTCKHLNPDLEVACILSKLSADVLCVASPFLNAASFLQTVYSKFDTKVFPRAGIVYKDRRVAG